MTLLALPLTALEEFLVWEDRPAYPFSIFVRLQFSGRIDPRALESAVQLIMPRHPLLTSRLEMRGRRPFWVVQPGALPRIVWAQGPTGQAMPATGRQDLRREIGLKLFVVESHDSSDVTLQCHHACCDGVGIQVFINDLMIAYALAKGVRSKRLQLPELDPGRLARRGAYGLTFWKLLKMLPRQIAGLPGVGHFFARSPSPLLPHRALPDDDPPPSGFPATRTHTFTREESEALHETAGRLGVTVNDLLARDVFLALGEWRACHGAGDDAWLRVMVPINLRSARDRLLPAANVIGSVFLDRRSRDFADPGKLLTGIADELHLIKENRLGLMFIYALRAFRLIPGGLKHNARRDKCTVSSIFSNMGTPGRRCPLPKENGRYVAGDVILEQIDGVAPIRPYNFATFLATDYAHRLTMTLHYDPRPVGAVQADDLMATFVRRLKATVSGNE
ncbi:MAG: condensation domain-containing protein [Betaproteobacteria bacterium]|nr:condensation domain-containing protein [Gammaproteobacteria bacterium]MDH3436649.1 condensation domain-containing protein [Betaproteobacteria bacterium]